MSSAPVGAPDNYASNAYANNVANNTSLNGGDNQEQPPQEPPPTDPQALSAYYHPVGSDQLISQNYGSAADLGGTVPQQVNLNSTGNPLNLNQSGLTQDQLLAPGTNLKFGPTPPELANPLSFTPPPSQGTVTNSVNANGGINQTVTGTGGPGGINANYRQTTPNIGANPQGQQLNLTGPVGGNPTGSLTLTPDTATVGVNGTLQLGGDNKLNLGASRAMPLFNGAPVTNTLSAEFQSNTGTRLGGSLIDNATNPGFTLNGTVPFGGPVDPAKPKGDQVFSAGASYENRNQDVIRANFTYRPDPASSVGVNGFWNTTSGEFGGGITGQTGDWRFGINASDNPTTNEQKVQFNINGRF